MLKELSHLQQASIITDNMVGKGVINSTIHPKHKGSGHVVLLAMRFGSTGALWIYVEAQKGWLDRLLHQTPFSYSASGNEGEILDALGKINGYQTVDDGRTHRHQSSCKVVLNMHGRSKDASQALHASEDSDIVWPGQAHHENWVRCLLTEYFTQFHSFLVITSKEQQKSIAQCCAHNLATTLISNTFAAV